MDFKQLLNDEQYNAVTTASSNVRVVAGAGSGKTRVLTYRIAFLISECNIAPWKILAITFTNKVAKEMRERVVNLLGPSASDLRIQTYHAFCCRILREDISLIGYPTNFNIIDEDDQEKIVKDIASEMGYKRGDVIVKEAIRYIGSNKSSGRLPTDIEITTELFDNHKKCLEIFYKYEERLHDTLCLDFDDLLIKAKYILTNYPLIQNKWQNRFEHILIDEFQDTNDLQYEIVKLLRSPKTSLFVVGDPDQTIYTWRGANQEIMLNLGKGEKFDTETIILNRNYRSTKTILEAANNLIRHNKNRVPKDLYTENDQGEAIKKTNSFRSSDEARWVVGEIQQLMRRQPLLKPSDFAILYRSAYLTLPFEKELTKCRIPYRVFGGLRFYQRKEIKDVIAYFRLISNKKDDVAFERIINIPKRNIGDTTVSYIKAEASLKRKSIYEYIEEWNDDGNSKAKAKTILTLRTLIEAIDEVRAKIKKNDEAYSNVLKTFIVNLGYYKYLEELDDDKIEERTKNVDTLFDDCLGYIKDNPNSLYDEYLQNIALLSAQDDMANADYISLMTVHIAKGLEFPYVFVIGLNDGVFPNQRTLDEEGEEKGLEEERRLCYVAFTRARKQLFLTCNREYSYTLKSQKNTSRFFKETGLEFKRFNPHLGEELAYNDSLKYRGPDYNNYFKERKTPLPTQPLSNNIEWEVGDICNHESFGEGRVTRIDGSIIDVVFKSCGQKTLVATHPKLSKISKGGFGA